MKVYALRDKRTNALVTPSFSKTNPIYLSKKHIQKYSDANPNLELVTFELTEVK